MARESQGCILYFTTSTPGTTVIAVGEVNSFSGPTGSAGVIDVSHLGSTAKEKLMGLPDEGSLSLSVNFLSSGDAGQVKLREQRAKRGKSAFILQFNTSATGEKCSAECYVTTFGISGSVDNKLQGDITLEITGPVTWSTA